MPDGREIVCQLPVATDHPRVPASALVRVKKLSQKQVEKKGTKMLRKFEKFWNGLCYRKTGIEAIIGYELCMGMWLAEIDLLSESGKGDDVFDTGEYVATPEQLKTKRVMGFFEQYFKKPNIEVESDPLDGRVTEIRLIDLEVRKPNLHPIYDAQVKTIKHVRNKAYPHFHIRENAEREILVIGNVLIVRPTFLLAEVKEEFFKWEMGERDTPPRFQVHIYGDSGDILRVKGRIVKIFSDYTCLLAKNYGSRPIIGDYIDEIWEEDSYSNTKKTSYSVDSHLLLSENFNFIANPPEQPLKKGDFIKIMYNESHPDTKPIRSKTLTQVREVFSNNMILLKDKIKLSSKHNIVITHSEKMKLKPTQRIIRLDHHLLLLDPKTKQSKFYYENSPHNFKLGLILKHTDLFIMCPSRNFRLRKQSPIKKMTTKTLVRTVKSFHKKKLDIVYLEECSIKVNAKGIMDYWYKSLKNDIKKLAILRGKSAKDRQKSLVEKINSMLTPAGFKFGPANPLVPEKNFYEEILEKSKKTKPQSQDTIDEHDPSLGSSGGYCKCPSGNIYPVGSVDGHKDCSSGLACEGGITGNECFPK
jgi:hypothetical protein